MCIRDSSTTARRSASLRGKKPPKEKRGFALPLATYAVATAVEMCIRDRPYAERTLGALGFHDVRTESYAMRSSVLDEVSSLLVGSSDVAAYKMCIRDRALTYEVV